MLGILNRKYKSFTIQDDFPNIRTALQDVTNGARIPLLKGKVTVVNNISGTRMTYTIQDF